MRLHQAARVSSFLAALVCFALLLGCGARDPRLTQIIIDPANPQMVKGAKLQLSATGIFDNETKEPLPAVVWETSQSDVVAIDTKGEVTGAGEGVAKVSAVYRGVTGSTSITVGPPALVSIAVSPNQFSLPVGESEQLTATGTYTDGSKQDLTQSVTWSSSESTASVSPAGAALAKGIGTATISATAGSVTGTASLAVTPAVVIALNIVPATLSLPLGSGSQLQAIATLSDGTQQSVSSSVIWQTSQATVATVNAQGYATAVGKGAAQLSAAYQGTTASASIAVGPPALVSIAVSPNQISLPAGETEQLTATGTFTDGTTQNLTQSATWISSGPAVANVSPAGSASAKAVGTATISATSGSVSGTASLTVLPAAVVALNVVPATLFMPLGTSSQLQVIATMSDGTTQNMAVAATWSSTQSGVAAVNAQGVVTAAGKGSAQVSATYRGLTGSASVTVGPPALVSIAVSPNPSSLPLGETKQLSATGTFTDGTTQDLTPSATWSSSGPTVASVNAAGLAVAKAVGTATISAASGSVAGTASLAVTAAVAVSVNVVPATLSVPLGSGSQLQAIANMSDGTQQTLSASVTWQTGLSGIATVSAQGYVTAVGKGVAQVSAAYQGLTGSASITVGPPALVSIAVGPNPSSLPIDETEQLTATGTFTDGSKQNVSPSATWSSSAPAIATVSATGSAVAKAVGTATITAASGSVTGTASLTVSPAAVVALNIVPATLSVLLGNSSQLTAIATLSDGTTQNMTGTATWSSMQPNIVLVSSGGLVTAEKIGSTTILAQGSGFTASADITVMPLLTVGYFSRVNAEKSGVDGTIRLTNPGLTVGSLCAMIYVFDTRQELNECCGCKVSDSGLRTLSVLNDLTANPLTGKKPRAGTIEIVSSDPAQNPQCNPGSLAPAGEILGWGTNAQGSGSNFQVTEETFANTALTTAQAAVLSTECSMLTQLGSGQGICTCGTGDDSKN
jgi:uncharacterized protein YjdB